MFGRRPDLWVTGLIVTAAALVILANFALVYVRTKTLRKSLADSSEPTRLALRSIKVATMSHAVLAIVAVLAGRQPRAIPQDWLTEPNIAFVVFVIDTDVCAAHDRRDRDLLFGGQYR